MREQLSDRTLKVRNLLLLSQHRLIGGAAGAAGAARRRRGRRRPGGGVRLLVHILTREVDQRENHIIHICFSVDRIRRQTGADNRHQIDTGVAHRNELHDLQRGRQPVCVEQTNDRQVAERQLALQHTRLVQVQNDSRKPPVFGLTLDRSGPQTGLLLTDDRKTVVAGIHHREVHVGPADDERATHDRIGTETKLVVGPRVGDRTLDRLGCRTNRAGDHRREIDLNLGTFGGGAGGTRTARTGRTGRTGNRDRTAIASDLETVGLFVLQRIERTLEFSILLRGQDPIVVKLEVLRPGRGGTGGPGGRRLPITVIHNCRDTVDKRIERYNRAVPYAVRTCDQTEGVVLVPRFGQFRHICCRGRGVFVFGCVWLCLFVSNYGFWGNSVDRYCAFEVLYDLIVYSFIWESFLGKHRLVGK